jgi:rubredoxin
MKIYNCRKCNYIFNFESEDNQSLNIEFCPMCPNFENLFNKKIKTIIHKILRFALTGQENGMNTAQIMLLLGRDKTLFRLKKCLEINENGLAIN